MNHMKKIHIQIKLFATLNKYTPHNSEHYPVPDGITADELATRLDLPVDQVKLIFINGQKCAPGTRLKQDDRIGIFPPVGGG